MIKEFEGKTEKEAIDKAVQELHIDRTGFDVEIVESAKKGIFRKGNVKIKVHLPDVNGNVIDQGPMLAPDNDTESELINFLTNMLKMMGFPGAVNIKSREQNKIGLVIDSDHSAILIGKKGKNLDALQLLVNVYSNKLGFESRVIIDTENYRARREESLTRLAMKMADQVRRSKGSRLLEPMNPFERRLIHTTLNDMNDITTKSEGDGLFKQVRIIYRR